MEDRKQLEEDLRERLSRSLKERQEELEANAQVVHKLEKQVAELKAAAIADTRKLVTRTASSDDKKHPREASGGDVELLVQVDTLSARIEEFTDREAAQSQQIFDLRRELEKQRLDFAHYQQDAESQNKEMEQEMAHAKEFLRAREEEVLKLKGLLQNLQSRLSEEKSHQERRSSEREKELETESENGIVADPGLCRWCHMI